MTASMMCAGVKAGGKDSCQGDSGGPLVVQDPANYNGFTLAGVVSWGFGCADADSLGIYAEVSHFTDWLNQKMPDLVTCPASTSVGTTSAPSNTTTTPSTVSTTPSTSSSTAAPPTSNTTCGSCVFPFIFNGRYHDTCTTIDGDAKPWCSKTADWQGQWEYCEDASCPGTSTETTLQAAVNPLNAPGNCCKLYSS